MIVTIACPPELDHPFVDKETAPVWVDKYNNEYYVASGLIEYIEPTVWQVASHDKITISVGVDGLKSLAEMGLTPKHTETSS